MAAEEEGTATDLFVRPDGRPMVFLMGHVREKMEVLTLLITFILVFPLNITNSLSSIQIVVSFSTIIIFSFTIGINTFRLLTTHNRGGGQNGKSKCTPWN